jgi:PAS domain S-box-containing protein
MTFESGRNRRHGFTMPDLDQQLRVYKTFASIIDFAYAFDAQGRFLYANQALLDLLGLRLEEIVGKTFLELPYPRELALKLQAQIRQVFDTRERLIDETAYVNPTGRTGYYEYIFNPVFDESGRVEIVVGSTREISHRKINEETWGRLAAIVDSSDDAIVSKDLSGIVTSWNAAAERIFGYTAAEMIGTSILRVIPLQLHHEEDRILSKIKLGQRIDHYETRRVRKNGEIFDVSLTISPVLNTSGVVIGTSKIARDISRRKHMELRLIEAEKFATTGRMAATIAHEVNNPLQVLSNLIFLARCETQGNPVADQHLAAAAGEIERISHLTRQTLGYYRDTTARAKVACHDLIQEVARVYQSKMQARNITLHTVFDTLRPVLASKGELTQVFSSIISNAVDAMPHGGRLHIQVSDLDAKNIQIVFQDEGTGIAPEDLSRIFEPFFTTKGNLGTGIGLWTAKQLMEKHGGHIGVASNTAPPNAGTTVRLVLRILGRDTHPAPTASQTASQTASPSPASPTPH